MLGSIQTEKEEEKNNSMNQLLDGRVGNPALCLEPGSWSDWGISKTLFLLHEASDLKLHQRF